MTTIEPSGPPRLRHVHTPQNNPETRVGDLFSDLNGLLHGPIHIMVGGQWWADASEQISSDLYGTIAEGFNMTDIPYAISDLLLTSKFMWRQGVIRCPEFCAADAPESECQCSCPDEIIAGRTASQVMTDYGVMHMSTPFMDTLVSHLNANGVSTNDLLKILCHVGHVGEMFSSAAPYDPLFWSLHGSAERFLGYKVRRAAAARCRGNVHVVLVVEVRACPALAAPRASAADVPIS